ncbi:MAG TPA: serine hydrolase domain-containing protein [Burkholderiaceae bacterium]|nr:serine hydrolase domain-containing protein [Burkholderiaceae bacterium]
MATPAETGLCPHRVDRLVDALQSEIDRERLPGAVALVARHGKLVLFKSLGQQDPASDTPMAHDALFRIYSMTKPIVSAAVMMLVEQGRLLLSDPVAKYLPEFSGLCVAVPREGRPDLEPALEPVAPGRPSIHDLLRHTAGLTYEFLGQAPVQRQYAKAMIGSRERSNAEQTQALATLSLMYAPGTVWEYSRSTDVLGRLVEVISGQGLGAFLRAHMLGPLGMHDTGFSVPPEHLGRVAEPFAHDPDGGVPMRVFDLKLPARLELGGGGLVSTAMDYARFLQCMLNKGELDGVRLLGPRSVALMTADHLGSIPVAQDSGSAALLLPGYGFGLGFAVRTAPGLAPEHGSVGSYHWGGLAGTTFFVDPAEDLFAVLMLQAPNQREYYRQMFRGMVYAALLD